MNEDEGVVQHIYPSAGQDEYQIGQTAAREVSFQSGWNRTVTLDGTTGAVYVTLRNGPAARTVAMPTDGMGLILNVDLDESGTVVGVEIV